jgi:hypothetical protein
MNREAGLWLVIFWGFESRTKLLEMGLSLTLVSLLDCATPV